MINIASVLTGAFSAGFISSGICFNMIVDNKCETFIGTITAPKKTDKEGIYDWPIKRYLNIGCAIGAAGGTLIGKSIRSNLSYRPAAIGAIATSFAVACLVKKPFQNPPLYMAYREPRNWKKYWGIDDN